MNAKKAKQLRRLLRDEMPMTVGRPLPIMRAERDKVTHRILWTPAGVEFKKRPVNHYRNAKKLYAGSVSKAIRAARRQAYLMTTLGVYKVA